MLEKWRWHNFCRCCRKYYIMESKHEQRKRNISLKTFRQHKIKLDQGYFNMWTKRQPSSRHSRGLSNWSYKAVKCGSSDGRPLRQIALGFVCFSRQKRVLHRRIRQAADQVGCSQAQDNRKKETWLRHQMHGSQSAQPTCSWTAERHRAHLRRRHHEPHSQNRRPQKPR